MRVFWLVFGCLFVYLAVCGHVQASWDIACARARGEGGLRLLCFIWGRRVQAPFTRDLKSKKKNYGLYGGGVQAPFTRDLKTNILKKSAHN